MRDEFDNKTKDILAKRVGFRCSNPKCRNLTCGPQEDENKFVNIGVAAHINAAAEGGPRYNNQQSADERKSIENGIWLCQNCSKLIDNDAKRYTSDLLQKWKKSSEQTAFRETGLPLLINTEESPHIIANIDVCNVEVRARQSTHAAHVEDGMSLLHGEYHEEINQMRDLIQVRPLQAILQFEQFKKRVWEKASEKIKFRILTNIGAAYLNIQNERNEREAANLFIKAFQYNQDDEKALVNKALGEIIFGRDDEARKYVDKALEKNSANERAWSLRLQIDAKQKSLKNLIQETPECFRSFVEVAHTIGYIARKQGDIEKAREYYELAHANDKEGIPVIKADLAGIYFELATKDIEIILGGTLGEENIALAKKAIGLLTEAWHQVATTELRKYRVGWLINLGVAKIQIGDTEGAKNDLAEAYKIDPEDPVSIKNYAVLLKEIELYASALNVLTKIPPNDVQSIVMVKAEVLWKLGRIKEAIAFMEQNSSYDDEIEAKRLLSCLYHADKQPEKALEMLGGLIENYPQNNMLKIDRVRINRQEGKEDAARGELDAVENIDDNDQVLLAVMADEYYALQGYEKAAVLYEKFVDRNKPSHFLNRMARAYYAISRKKALEIVREYRLRNGVDEHLTNLEYVIHYEIGDYEKTLEILEIYRKTFPKVINAALDMCVLLWKFGQTERFLELLSEIEINSDAEPEQTDRYARLCVAANWDEKALDFLYQAWRVKYGDPIILRAFMSLMLNRRKDEDKWVDMESVSDVAAVCVKDINGPRWYVIEKTGKADLKSGELPPELESTRDLIGKRVGDRVNDGEIVEIHHKYVRAFRKTITEWPFLFRNQSGLQQLAITGDTDEDKKNSLKNIMQKQMAGANMAFAEIEKLYIEKSLPIGMFANLLRRNVIEVMGYTMGREDLGVRCCRGTKEERKVTKKWMAGNPKIVIDLLSLVVLHSLGLADNVVKVFGKLRIARSTLEELQAFREEKQQYEKDGILRVDSRAGEFVCLQISPEQVVDNVAETDAILRWAESNCEILPVQEALSINTTIKKEFDKFLGESFVDSILLAKQPGCLLYSDDASLREMAKSLYGIDGIWTQVLLMHCQHEGALGKQEYNTAVIKLTCSNFKYTSINADVLDEAYKISEYHYDKELKYMISKLTESHVSIDTMIGVSVGLVFRILGRTIRRHQYDVVIFALLDDMAKGRSALGILRRLRAEVEKQNPFNTKVRQEALGIVKKWEDTKPVIN